MALPQSWIPLSPESTEETHVSAMRKTLMRKIACLEVLQEPMDVALETGLSDEPVMLS